MCKAACQEHIRNQTMLPHECLLQMSYFHLCLDMLLLLLVVRRHGSL